MEIALRERNLDIFLLEFGPDRVVEIAAQRARRSRIVARPNTQNLINRAVTKLLEQDVGFRRAQHARMGGGDLEQCTAHLLGVRFV